MHRVLHLLSQRAEKTGSGVTLDAMVHNAGLAGYKQHVLCAIAQGDRVIEVGGLSTGDISTVEFEGHWLPFPIVGMSDVMPYRSSVWSRMSVGQLRVYREVFESKIASLVHRFQPDIIHSHHIWLMSSLVKQVAPAIPVVATCHATGLRQMSLCEQSLVDEVKEGCRAIDHFTVLHDAHRKQLCSMLDVDSQRVTVVGAGYREATFGHRAQEGDRDGFLYAGKFSRAKGLDVLLNVMRRRQDWSLHVAGGGTGEEAEMLEAKMRQLPNVTVHGMLSQHALAELMYRSQIFVLPSYYEGLPLVLVEAAACGCRLVSTALPGVTQQLLPHLGRQMKLVQLPRLVGPDTPVESEVPAFERRLESIMSEVKMAGSSMSRASLAQLERFGWAAVFKRVEAVWQQVVAPT